MVSFLNQYYISLVWNSNYLFLHHHQHLNQKILKLIKLNLFHENTFQTMGTSSTWHNIIIWAKISTKVKVELRLYDHIQWQLRANTTTWMNSECLKDNSIFFSHLAKRWGCPKLGSFGRSWRTSLRNVLAALQPLSSITCCELLKPVVIKNILWIIIIISIMKPLKNNYWIFIISKNELCMTITAIMHKASRRRSASQCNMSAPIIIFGIWDSYQSV